ncbi:MAG: hypothetical protein CMQ20_16915 [Gammaproteobacteria bacterium]|nr:hypothetical protein [Gammaproteobacteria bacterium]
MKLPFPLTCLLLFILFLLLVGALHYPGLNAPMYYDSATRIAGNHDLFSSGMIENVLAIFPQRPLPMATFYFNFLLTDMEPAYFRIFNLLLLSATALTLVLLINLILDLPGIADHMTSTDKRKLSLTLGVFFLVHPFHTYLTLYIWQRMALMSCLFYCLSMLAYVAVRSRKLNQLPGYGLSLMFYICAQSSKENSFTLPLILILFELVFFQQSWRNIFNRGAILGSIALLVIGTLAILQHPHGNEDLGSGILATIVQYYKESDITLFDAALTQSRTLFEYIGIILAPTPDRAQLVQPYVISRSLLDPVQTLPSVIGALALLAAAFYLLRKRPLSGFGLLFFLVNISPESILAPQYAFFGYRASLPMAGLLLVVADVVLIATRRVKKTRSTNVGIAALLSLWILIAAGATTNRAVLWGAPILFWQGVVDRIPESRENLERKVASQALSNLSAMLQSEERHLEALTYSERAVELTPERANYHYKLASSYLRLGLTEEGEQQLRDTLELEADFAWAHFLLGRLLLEDGHERESRQHLETAEQLMPKNADLQNLLGLAYLGENQFAPAKEHFHKGIRINPQIPEVYYHLALTLLSEGKAQQSIEYSNRALQLKDDYWLAYNNLGLAHAQLNQPERVIFYLKKALAINPADETIRKNLARFQAERGIETQQE